MYSSIAFQPPHPAIARPVFSSIIFPQTPSSELKNRPLHATSLLVLLMIIHLRVPKQRLIPIAPEVILRPDVLVRVLGLLFQGRAVSDVLPVLGPQAVGVDAGHDEAGDYDVD